jgi:hypothetical protein
MRLLLRTSSSHQNREKKSGRNPPRSQPRLVNPACLPPPHSAFPIIALHSWASHSFKYYSPVRLRAYSVVVLRYADNCARHSLADIIAPAPPGRALQTLQVDSRGIMMSPPVATIAAAPWGLNVGETTENSRELARTTRPSENCRDCHENGEAIARPLDSRETETIGENSRLMCNTALATSFSIRAFFGTCNAFDSSQERQYCYLARDSRGSYTTQQR